MGWGAASVLWCSPWKDVNLNTSFPKVSSFGGIGIFALLSIYWVFTWFGTITQSCWVIVCWIRLLIKAAGFPLITCASQLWGVHTRAGNEQCASGCCPLKGTQIHFNQRLWSKLAGMQWQIFNDMRCKAKFICAFVCCVCVFGKVQVAKHVLEHTCETEKTKLKFGELWESSP